MKRTRKIINEIEIDKGIARITETKEGIYFDFIPNTERGNKATDWILTPEDIEKCADDVIPNKKELGIIERLEEQVRDLQNRVEKLEKLEENSMKGRLF